MELGYKIIFCGRSLYNEIDVPLNNPQVGIGSVAGCKARFSKSVFNQDFLAIVTRTNTGWNIKCEAGICIRDDGKIIAEKTIQQGDFVSFISSISGKDLFSISIQINYEDSLAVFNRRIDVRNVKQLAIGNNPACNLFMTDADGYECFRIEYCGNYLRLSIDRTNYGVYVNGTRMIGICKVMEHDFISCGIYNFFFSNGYLFYTNGEKIRINGLNAEKIIESCSALEYPKFHRNTRIKEVVSDEPISILDPPEIPQKPTDNLVMTLLPAIAMLVLVVVLRGVMSSSGGSYIIFSVCSMSLGIATSIFNYVKSQKDYKKSLVEREETYRSYIARKKEEISNERILETNKFYRIYPSSEETIKRINDFSGSLFDRTLSDEDFLHIRLGMGRKKAKRTVSYSDKEKLTIGDELQEIPHALAGESEELLNAPIIADLKEAGIIGIVGKKEDNEEFFKVLIEDLCSRQFSQEVSVFTICSKEQYSSKSWMRYLPHLKKENGLLRNISYDSESCELQFEYLFNVLSLRDSLASDIKNSAIVVFVLDEMGFYTHPVSKYLENAKDLGVYFIFISEVREKLPLFCGNIIQLLGNRRAVLYCSGDASDYSEFVFDQISDDTMWNIAMKLAPVYVEDVSVEGNLPRSFSIFSLLGISGADDLDLAARWNNTDITKSMAAPLGLKSGDEIVCLDLHEKFHGPHGLVAGTTGSGKSEIIQSYILSMATLYSPYEVGFVIIDFKGGGMANLFADLPHLVGAITDIDGKEINRSLMSIRAELDKRKRYFAAAEVNNITDYIKKYKAGDSNASEPLPHLILIIDEFAELKASQPEFMKEVISAARVGRSLGIHLILATQKPAGVIDEQIWSNSKFKLCLKVQSKSDSNEVIKSPLAAEIREPGRAYLQVGNNEIFDLFQSAYSGGPARSEEMDNIQPFQLFEVDGCGRRKMIYDKKVSKSSAGANAHIESQLEAITNKVAEYCKQSGIERLPSICMPPLESNIEFPENYKNAGTGSMDVEIGIYDDPSTQSQRPVSIDLCNNNLLIIGSSQSGKTNLLMTIIKGLAINCSPEEVNFYILDFGPSILSNFGKMPHVGGVVSDNEDEKVKNLFKFINGEIAIRKQKIMKANVSSFAAYREAGYKDIPLIVLVLDNFTAFKENYLNNEDFFLPITRNGLAVGISVVMANQNMQGLGYRYLASFSKRIAFHCNDSNEYASVIDKCRTYPNDIPGRSVLSIDKTIYEMQVFSAFAGEIEKDKVDRQLEFIASRELFASGKRAKQIPMVPEELALSVINNDRVFRRKSVYDLCFGLDYETINVASLELDNVGAFAVVGKENASSNAFFKDLMIQLSTLGKEKVELFLCDSTRQTLSEYAKDDIVKAYVNSSEGIVEIVNQVYKEVQDRTIECAQKGYAILEDRPLLLVVGSGNDSASAISKDNATVGKYKEILDRYSDMKVCFLYLNVDNAEVSYSGPEVLKRLKDSRSIIFFDNLTKLKFIQVSQADLRHASKIKEKDGYVFSEGEAVRIKVATPE